MSERLYRIVSQGELAYGFEVDEARGNVQQLCKYDDSTLDRLFSGEPFVLKNNLPLEAARKYKDALDQTGAVCLIEKILPKQKTLEKEPTEFTCPKCQQPQPPGPTCDYCGIVFARYEQMLARKAAAERGEPSAEQSSEADPSAAGDAGAMERLERYFADHKERAFILKAFLTIGLIIFVREFLGDFLLLLLLMFPAFFFCYIRYQAATTGQSFMGVLAQNITFMPVMYAEGERKAEGIAWATYGIILVNVLVYYGFQLQVEFQFILDHLIFIPYEPNAFNVPFSLISSIFLHGDGGHLWGNMMFLWAVGTVVEKRIGWKRFTLFYFITGIAADLLPAIIDWGFFHRATHGLGASGAISGVMGLFAVRCYFKSMVFPLPILGFLPISLKVRLNSLVIIGLFFLADLSGGIDQVTGEGQSNIGYWAHIGGMLCGIALGMLYDLGGQAVEERHIEIGSQALDKKGDLYQGEESLRFALEKNPENTEVMILLARLLSNYEPTEEGARLYRQAMDLLIKARPNAAAETFKEYYELYLTGTTPQTQFRLASCYHQQQDHEWAACCLELLADDVATPEEIREKAMFQCARQMEIVGKFDVARHYYRLFVETFPMSPFTAKVQARLADS